MKAIVYVCMLISLTILSANSVDQELGRHAGYYSLPHTKGARMFYYLFESRKNASDDPVVVWLSGGPGCSGSAALFYENGPFHLTDNLSLDWNQYTWNKETNLIYLDQPIGTGFSYSPYPQDDIPKTSDQAAIDFYNFLQAFFEEHPEYTKNDFYITGDSYAGHYIPAFAALILQKNKKNEGTHINLKGVAIGNGWTDPAIQTRAYLDYALEAKLINASRYGTLNRDVESCEDQLQACSVRSDSCESANSICRSILPGIRLSNISLNHYDIRKKCEFSSLCYDFSRAERFLNQPMVQQALGVVANITFVICNGQVHEAMSVDYVKNFSPEISVLLEQGIKVLIYAGEYDLVCNWLGNSRWVESLNWSGHEGYLSAQWVPFTVEGVEAGIRKRYGALSFLKVYDAGHLVPMDQPMASLQMLNQWISDLI